MAKVEIELSEEQLAKLKPSDSPIKICVLDRSWVFVGRVSKEDDWIRIDNASCIRVWGTTKGLGELKDGPTSKTVLDKSGTIRFPIKSLICMFECSENGWGKLC